MRKTLQKLIAATPGHHIQTLKNLVMVFALRGLQRLLGVTTTYFIVRAISQEQFGEYNLILTYIGLMAVFALPGFKESTMQSVARNHEKTYCMALKITFLSSMIGAAILAGFGVWHLTHDESPILAYGFMIAAASFPATNGLELWKSIHAGKSEFKKLTRIEGLSTTVSSVAIIAGVYFFPGTFLIPLAVSLGVVATLNSILSASSYFSLCTTNSTTEDGSITYGLKTSLYMAVMIFAHNIDRILVFYFLSPASLAIYAAATRFPDLFKNLFQDVAGVLAPRFATHKHYTKRLDRFFKLFSLIMGTAILLFTFTIFPWLFSLIFGEPYKEAIPYAQALMCSAAFANTASLRMRYIKSKLDTKSVRNVYVLTSIFRVISTLFLIAVFGLAGAVATNFTYKIFMTLIIGHTLKKRYSTVENLERVVNQR